MKTKLIMPVILFFALLANVVSAQSADDVVNKFIEARGGKAKWDQLTSLKMTGNIDIGPNMKAPFTILMKDKTKFRFEMEIQGMKMIQALDGDSGWAIVPFGGKKDPERMSPDDVKTAQEQADYTGDLYDYKKKGNTVELLGKEDMEGTETYKLKVTKKNQDVIYIYLDANTYLTLKETSKHKFKDKEVEGSSLPSNYKDVNGYKFPFVMEMRGSDEDSNGQSMTIETVEVNPKIDNTLFVMPPVASAVEPPKDSK